MTEHLTHDEAHAILFNLTWKFQAGSLLEHRTRGLYHILLHAIDAETKQPVYVLSPVGGEGSYTTWTRPKWIVEEEGRFTVFHPGTDTAPPTTLSDIEQQRFHEALEAVEDLVGQHCADDAGNLDSGCLSANAHAIRVLALTGRAILTSDGPGRHVSARLLDRAAGEIEPRPDLLTQLQEQAKADQSELATLRVELESLRRRLACGPQACPNPDCVQGTIYADNGMTGKCTTCNGKGALLPRD